MAWSVECHLLSLDSGQHSFFFFLWNSLPGPVNFSKNEVDICVQSNEYQNTLQKLRSTLYVRWISILAYNAKNHYFRSSLPIEGFNSISHFSDGCINLLTGIMETSEIFKTCKILNRDSSKISGAIYVCPFHSSLYFIATNISYWVWIVSANQLKIWKIGKTFIYNGIWFNWTFWLMVIIPTNDMLCIRKLPYIWGF